MEGDEAREEASTQMAQGSGEWVKVWVSASRVQDEFRECNQSLP